MNEFLSRMRDLLGDEFGEYLRCYESGNFRGLRVNTLKCTPERLRELSEYELEPTPFCPEGFYLPDGVQSPGNSPLHHCGAFYIQEPSATSAAEMLGVEKGDFVLDLCAAPGGKSTQLGAKLDRSGLLWSNEIVRSRANILLSNIERMGIPNAVVSNAHPEVLCERLANRFDRVLVDAPCSGEGMFRKNGDAQTEWSVEHVRSCAERQLHILNSAKKALRQGGVMVYSTCTFSREENEGVIERFLAENPDFALEDAGVSFGRATMEHARRIFPMDGGEGHFAARLRKAGEREGRYERRFVTPRDSAALDFYDSLFIDRPFGENIVERGGRIMLLPECLDPSEDFGGIPVLRAGLILGEQVKRRIEPHHSAFMAARAADCVNAVDFDADSAEVRAFLHGEEIDVPGDIKGWTAVAVSGMTTGFGKASNGRLKNKYPKGLRTLK